MVAVLLFEARRFCGYESELDAVGLPLGQLPAPCLFVRLLLPHSVCFLSPLQAIDVSRQCCSSPASCSDLWLSSCCATKRGWWTLNWAWRRPWASAWALEPYVAWWPCWSAVWGCLWWASFWACWSEWHHWWWEILILQIRTSEPDKWILDITN